MKPSRPKSAYDNQEFIHSSSGRVVRILAEFIEPERRFKQNGVQDTVVFFGSARTLPLRESRRQLRKLKSNPKTTAQEFRKAELAVEMSQYYEDATALARKITLWGKAKKVNLAICSGGGPGIMEAANKGARQASGPSIGLNINLPFEQEPNPYISKHLNFEFHYFFLRKFWFLYHAKALVVFPGGFGTLDEMMEVLTLIQTQKVKKDMLVVVYGKKFWDKVINFNYLVETGMIDEGDLKRFRFCDTVDEAFDYLTRDLQRFLYKRQRPTEKFQPWVLDI